MRAADGGGGARDERRDNRGRGDRRDFGSGDNARPRNDGNADVIRQLAEVNTKLDRIIRAMEKPAPASAPEVVKQGGTLKQAVKRATDSKKKK